MLCGFWMEQLRNKFGVITMLTVYDLSRDQLSALKYSFFWQDETQDILPENITDPEQIPDDIIFEHYNGVCFVEDDFA